MLITFIPGQQDKQHSSHAHHSANPSLAQSSAVGSRGLMETLFCQEDVPKLSHTASQRGITRVLCSCEAQTSCQPQLAPPHAHLERSGPCTGCSPHESASHGATSSSKSSFSWRSFTYQHSRVYILLHQSKLTGLTRSSTQQPAKPVFWGENWVPGPTAIGQLLDLHCLLPDTASSVFRWLTDLPSSASSLWKSCDSDVLWHLKKSWENSLFLSHSI